MMKMKKNCKETKDNMKMNSEHTYIHTKKATTKIFIKIGDLDEREWFLNQKIKKNPHNEYCK